MLKWQYMDEMDELAMTSAKPRRRITFGFSYMLKCFKENYLKLITNYIMI